MRDIAAAADAYYDRMWDAKCADDELAEYLEENDMTMEDYEAMVEQSRDDAAEAAADWADYSWNS